MHFLKHGMMDTPVRLENNVSNYSLRDVMDENRSSPVAPCRETEESTLEWS